MPNRSEIDIILLSQFRWDGPYSSISIAMAKEFAKKNRVFFINHPNTLRDLGPVQGLQKRETTFETVASLEDRLISVDPATVLPINFLGEGWLYNRLANYNAQVVTQAIQDVIHQFDVKQYIYINCFDPFYPTRPPVQPKPLLHIYQCVDNIAESEYLKKHGPRLEATAIKQADLCLVTSTELRRLKKALNSNTKILHNAADLQLFSRVLTERFARPQELASVEGKVIGFVGNLDQQRIDYSLLLDIAKSHRDKTLLLIGPMNNTTAREIGLTEEANVIFTGGKKIEELPPYLQHMDCALIPFQCNDLTKSIYPLKVNEYLAAGRPVVSTVFSPDIHDFANEIYLADSNARFIHKIEQAIQGDNPMLQQQRNRFAAANSWEGRIREFWDIVQLETTPQNKTV